MGRAVIVEPDITREESDKIIAELEKLVKEITLKMIRKGELEEA